MGRYFTIGLIWISLLFTGLAPALSAAEEAAPPLVPALQRGIAQYHSGDSQEALSVLRSFVINNYDSTQLPIAYLYLARIFQDSGNHEDALLYLNRIPRHSLSSATELTRAISLIATGQSAAGMALLQSLERETLQPADQLRLLSALARGKSQQELGLEALSLIHRGIGLNAADPGELLEQAHHILRDQLNDIDLAEASFIFSGHAIGQDALLQRALRAARIHDETTARELTTQVVQSPIPFPYRQDAVHLWESLTGSAWSRRAVGVILPLSGRYATFGNLVRRGMELALLDPQNETESVDFIFRDSFAEPDQSAMAVSELVTEAGVLAIAGPLTGNASTAAAEEAQRFGVPIVSMSPRAGLAHIGPQVFRNFMTSQLQVQALVRYAMEEQGKTSFAVLYPENKLGRSMTDLFIEEVEMRGGLVAALQSYPETATDYRYQIKLLKGEDPNAPEEDDKPAPAEGEGEEELSEEPPLPFEAIFIPDDASRVAMIAPQLVFYGIEDMPLLGTNGWNSSELLQSAGRYLEGAVIVDGFFTGSPYPQVQEFIQLYQQTYGEAPSFFEAQGYDIARILLSLLTRRDITTRMDLQRALSQLRSYSGATGTTSFNPYGDAEKDLFLLQVQKGQFVQIN